MKPVHVRCKWGVWLVDLLRDFGREKRVNTSYQIDRIRSNFQHNQDDHVLDALDGLWACEVVLGFS